MIDVGMCDINDGVILLLRLLSLLLIDSLQDSRKVQKGIYNFPEAEIM